MLFLGFHHQNSLIMVSPTSFNVFWVQFHYLYAGRCSTCEHCLSVQLASFYVNTFEEIDTQKKLFCGPREKMMPTVGPQKTFFVGRVWAATFFWLFMHTKYQEIISFYCILSHSQSKVTSCSYTQITSMGIR